MELATIGCGIYPNLGIHDCGFSIVRDGEPVDINFGGGGATTDVVVSPVTVIDALNLRFTMPDTSAELAPHGLSGPATIRVEHAITTDNLWDSRR